VSTQAAGRGTLDVSGLPGYAFGYRDPVWWGVLLLVAIEGTAMGLLLVSALYVRGNFQFWPPVSIGHPALRLATLELILLAASYLPMVMCVRASRREQLRPTRAWLIAATVLGAAMLIVRGFEVPRIPFRWDSNAYGSLFWMTFGVHVSHVLTGVLENGMMIALLLKGPVEQKHFADVEATALLWYFSVLEWVPAFAIIYLQPLLDSR
jgi:cytochrome c oxidase subunit 3